MKNNFEQKILEDISVVDNVENDVYNASFVDNLLENDELSFEEAAFMSGYSDFN